MTQAEGRSFFREVVTEPDTTIVADAAIDTFLDRGMEALNALIGFHHTDDTSITTVNGTQEYTLPTDSLSVVWVEYGTAMLDRLTQEEYRNLETDFRDTAAGTPTSYYLVGRKIGLHPKPGAAVQLTIRSITTPVAYGTTAFSQLATQDHRLPVYYAAQLWLTAHGFDAGFARAERLLGLFTAEAERAKAFYDARRLSR